MLCCEGRTCFEMEGSSLYRGHLNKTFRTEFSSLLNMVVQEIAHFYWTPRSTSGNKNSISLVQGLLCSEAAYLASFLAARYHRVSNACHKLYFLTSPHFFFFSEAFLCSCGCQGEAFPLLHSASTHWFFIYPGNSHPPSPRPEQGPSCLGSDLQELIFPVSFASIVLAFAC